MKVISTLSAIALSLTSVFAEVPSLQEEIDTRKNANRKNADPKKVADYAAGIDAIREAKVLDGAKKKGDKAPDFTLTESKGSAVTLSEELKKGPVVLTWYRGGWCPYCNIQLAAYQKILPQIEELGAQLIAVSPELPDKSLSTKEKNELRFPVLTDLNLKVAGQYGLVFKLTSEVSDHYSKSFSMKDFYGDDSSGNELPIAATYVIDQNGKIVYAFLDEEYTKRAEPKDILEALDGLE